MLTIQIRNWANKTIAVLNNIYSLQVDDEVNRGGKLKLVCPIEKWMQTTQLKKGYKITINYGVKIGRIIKLFDGYITDIIISTNNIEIQGENWLSYLQNRIIRNAKTYTDTTIADIIAETFTTLNTTYALPISLWLNDCTTTISNEFTLGTSFYDILRYCREAEEDLIVRVLDWVLEVSKNTGKILDWVREYDASNTRSTNIASWQWKDTMDNYYTYIQNENGSVIDEDTIEEMWLIFEKYENDRALVLPRGEAIPSVSVTRDTDWWDFNVGDRKQIRLYTWYNWLPLEYLWLIQNRKVNITANWWLKADIKISEKYKSETNILDLVLSNLRKK